MNHSSTRLTLYALIVALEEDLRGLILRTLPSSESPERLFGADLFERTIVRFQAEHGADSYISNFEDLLPFLDFPDSYELLSKHKVLLGPESAKDFQSLVPMLAKLTPIRNRVCHSRPLQFDDLPRTIDAISNLKEKIPNKWYSLDELEAKIEENPGHVLDLVLPPPPKDKIGHNLPIPDFDETGFMGRKDQLRKLDLMMAGPYPVISIIGEGGLGKSALALKVAYDQLDKDDAVFDCIVWSSAKTSKVTASEIKRIENAISDSLGMFRSVAEELTGQSIAPEDPIEEILSYLKEFKILLILDNLETIIDESLLEFFERLPIGSKIITTSRIGLGQFERLLTLEPMKNPEAAQLLRAVSKVRGVSLLSEAPQPRINSYCNKLKNNPGFIKWFVSAIQAGCRPEQALQNTNVFLDFCLSNVYDYISNDGKRLLNLMQVVSRSLSVPEFAFLMEIEPVRLQKAIHQLLQTNMLSMSTYGEDIAAETKYSLSELSRAYIVKTHPVSSKDYSLYKKRERDFNLAQADYTSGRNADPSSAFRISVRNKSDAIIARYLVQALNLQKKGLTEEALEKVETAKELSPGYYEIYRVEAWISAQTGNVPAAKRAYENALELETGSPHLYIWYAGFLQRHESDLEQARELLGKALKIDPSNFHAKLEMARVLLHLRLYAQATELLDQLRFKERTLNARLRRIYWDLYLQIPSREADALTKEQDYYGCVKSAQRLLEALSEVPREFLDVKFANRLNSTYRSVNKAKSNLIDVEHRKEASKVLGDITTELDFLGTRPRPDDEERFEGVIESVKGYFGFISTKSGKQLYYNELQFRPADRNSLEAGATVDFSIGRNTQGECAVSCRLSSRKG